MSDKLLTINRAVAATGMSDRTIRRRIAQGEIPAVIDPRDRRRKLIRVDELRRFLGDIPLRKVA